MEMVKHLNVWCSDYYLSAQLNSYCFYNQFKLKYNSADKRYHFNCAKQLSCKKIAAVNLF